MKIIILFHRIFFVPKYYFIPNLVATSLSGNSNRIYFEETYDVLFHYVPETAHTWSDKEHEATHDRLNKVLGTKQN